MYFSPLVRLAREYRTIIRSPNFARLYVFAKLRVLVGVVHPATIFRLSEMLAPPSLAEASHSLLPTNQLRDHKLCEPQSQRPVPGASLLLAMCASTLLEVLQPIRHQQGGADCPLSSCLPDQTSRILATVLMTRLLHDI